MHVQSAVASACKRKGICVLSGVREEWEETVVHVPAVDESVFDGLAAHGRRLPGVVIAAVIVSTRASASARRPERGEAGEGDGEGEEAGGREEGGEEEVVEQGGVGRRLRPQGREGGDASRSRPCQKPCLTQHTNATPHTRSDISMD